MNIALRLFRFVLRKFRCLNVIRNFFTKFALIFPKGSKLIFEDACSILNSIAPDCGASCICSKKNDIEDKFDLHIIVPVYNVEKYLDDCILSILNQKTKYSYFVTFVDDGSTDESCKILEKYKEKLNVEIVKKKNGGASSARNLALKSIRGRYIAFVDSDDLMENNAIELLLNKAYETDADIVGGAYCTFFGDRVYFERKQRDSDANKNLFGQAWGKIFKSKMFENICFSEGYMYEDELMYQILYPMALKGASISQIVYRYRMNFSGVTYSAINDCKSIDCFWVQKHLLKDRFVLGLSIDQYNYERFLDRTIFNWNCTSPLKNKKINKALFFASLGLFKSYYFNFSTNRKECQLVERFFKEENYFAYLVYCNLL